MLRLTSLVSRYSVYLLALLETSLFLSYNWEDCKFDFTVSSSLDSFKSELHHCTYFETMQIGATINFWSSVLTYQRDP